MCFFKTLFAGTPTIKKQRQLPQAEPKEARQFSNNVLETERPTQSFNVANLSPHEELLRDFVSLVTFNSHLIKDLNERLCSTQALLDHSGELFNAKSEEPAPFPLQPSLENENQAEPKDGSESVCLLRQIFGKQVYRFQFVLANPFKTIVYKERNFNFSVKLIDLASRQPCRNNNLINVCLGVCDEQGKWIDEGRDGRSFLKGKIEIEIYHGQGQFRKISATEVSRHFSSSKYLNFIVYAKPSMLTYTGDCSRQCYVPHELIQPLMIKNVIVKAKKSY